MIHCLSNLEEEVDMHMNIINIKINLNLNYIDLHGYQTQQIIKFHHKKLQIFLIIDIKIDLIFNLIHIPNKYTNSTFYTFDNAFYSFINALYPHKNAL